MSSPNTAPSNPNLPDFLHKYDSNLDGIISADEYIPIDQLSQPQKEHLRQKLAFLIGDEIFRANKQIRDYLVPTEGISFDEFRLLSVLYNRQALAKAHRRKGLPEIKIGLSQKAMALETNLSTSFVSNVLDKLDRQITRKDPREWITRIENEDNRKEKLILLTAQGCKNFLIAKRGFKAQIQKAFSGVLTLAQLIELHSELLKINSALSALKPPP